MSGYTIAQMRELLRMAKLLGFQDDVRHWERELKAAEQGEAENR